MESSRDGRTTPKEGSSSKASALAYTSSNGDRWFLRDGSDGKQIVRHVKNAASGGHMTEWDAAEFLALRPAGPEHDAVRKMLGRGV